MTLHERLLRLLLERHKAAALLGDLEEDAARRGASNDWVRREAFSYAAGAGWLAARRTKGRIVTTLRLAIRDAWRSIWRFKATSALAIVILTLAIATGVATYAVVDNIVLRPLPYPESHRLVALFGTTPRGPTTIVSPADYYAWKERTASFEALAAFRSWSPVTLPGETQAEPVGMVLATSTLFDVLRAPSARHALRLLSRSERRGAGGAHQPRVVAQAVWKRPVGHRANDPDSRRVRPHHRGHARRLRLPRRIHAGRRDLASARDSR